MASDVNFLLANFKLTDKLQNIPCEMAFGIPRNS